MPDRTTEYAKLVVSGKRLCGNAEIQACQRHLDDLCRKDFEYIFDVDEAERHINIANTMTIGEGQQKQPLVTRGFQNFILGSLMGWRKKRSKERRFREAYIQMARQNGKSFLAGELCNDFATFSGYHEGRIFCTATKMDQAKIVWKEVQKFIKSDKELGELYSIKEYISSIISLITGTEIRAIGRDTNSADGFRSILAIVDEYHAHATDQMYKLMLDGQVNVDSALTVAITTAGFNLNGPCHQQYLFAKKILERVIRKESLFVYIAEINLPDRKKDPEGFKKALWDPRSWAMANPLVLWKNDTELDKEMLARIAEKAIDAKEKGGKDLVNFMTKTLNTWVTYTGGSLIDLQAWKNCGSKRTLEDMRGREAYLGIDLSSGGDLTSIVLLFPLEENKVYIWSKSYMPELRLIEHQKTDEAPYGEWAEAGILSLTSGMYGIKTDYKAIIADLRQIMQSQQIKIIGCGYDSHNASAFLSDLEEILDCDLTEVKQSARSLNDATKDFQLTVEALMVEYDERNALLTWSVVNAILSAPNSFGEIKIDKTTQTERIDPVDAVMDAWKLWFTERDAHKVTGEDALDAWLEITEDGET